MRRRGTGLGDTRRMTVVDEVRECQTVDDNGNHIGKGLCCAKKRRVLKDNENAKGNFERLCRKAGLTLKVGNTVKQFTKNEAADNPPTIEPATESVGGLTMAKRRKHYALKAYGEPFGGIGGVMGDFLNVDEWKNFGKVALGGLGTAMVAPKIIAQLDKTTFAGKYLPYLKGGISVAAGFAAYKYGARKVPGKWRDAVVAASGVLAGLGLATIGSELFDKGSIGSKQKALLGLGNLFPVTIGDVGADESALLSALGAVEDMALSGAQYGAGDFGDVFDNDSIDADIHSMALAADVDGQDQLDFPNPAGYLGPNEAFGDIDASVEPQDIDNWTGDVDLATVALITA